MSKPANLKFLTHFRLHPPPRPPRQKKKKNPSLIKKLNDLKTVQVKAAKLTLT